MLDQHKQAFREEALELLAELESGLLELEKFPEDKALIATIFRALHTIKGSSGMFGYDDISMFTHDIETIFDLVRSGKLTVSKQIIDLTFKSLDYIKAMLDDSSSKKFSELTETKEILHSFRALINSTKSTTPETVTSGTIVQVADTQVTQIYYIHFKPNEDIFLSGTNPLLLLNELEEMGPFYIRSRDIAIPAFTEMNPEKCYTAWDIVLSSNKNINSIKDIFIFVEDDSTLCFTVLSKEGVLISEDAVELFLKETAKLNKLVDNDIISLYVQSQQKKNVDEQHIREADRHKIHHDGEVVSSIRVSAEKIDQLVNLVGELVTLQAQLTQVANETSSAILLAIAESVERITWDLRDSALNIRMLPIGTTFGKFNRLIRDLSKELGKEVELITLGAETELDKTVIEKISDPLIHLLRNSLDHGIETPEVRQLAGKNPVGKVTLKAFQSGGYVVIQIVDDGAGIDKEALRTKAVNLGLLSPETLLSDADTYALMFNPGLSTAKQVTSVSGRGVGMDVVKKAIDNLRGTIEVKSEKGKGSTLSLKIPLTLAIIDGLLIRVQDQFYILPLSSVEECVELTRHDTVMSNQRNLINIRSEIVPYIRLRDFFLIKGERPEIEQVVVVDINGIRVGFVVDTVVGQHQTVLKSLGALYKNVEGISGATILGDGRVALTLDINKIAELQEIEEKSTLV
ncbi:MAG: chemotaxis protein CheA [Ignavibacteria bacterium]|nr:chemotaxis protein CheA [Ignavibacteria bacterium]